VARKAVHEHRIDVRFGDCDPAGIVYFPRYFDYFHQAMETWFDALGGPAYAAFITQQRRGLPTVHTEADFASPARFGEALVIELRVLRIGRTSMEIAFVVRGAASVDDTRATGRSVVVVMDLEPTSPAFRRAVPLDDELRARIESWMEPSL
jgi:4-hydroxybenzoyl-CoA thioesterase